MADLNSFSPIRHPPPSEKRGILTNKTNTNTANQYQPQLNFSAPQTSAPAQQQAAMTQYQPPNYVPHVQSRKSIGDAAATNQKQTRNNSVQSQKSIGDAAANNSEKRDNNPTLREHPRKTIVAFGLTTKVDETIKGIRPTPVPYKHPIGSTKDIMDLRKTVEHLSKILQSQHEEIQQLKATIEVQDKKYIFVLDSNTKLYERLGNLEKRISSSTPNNIKVNHVMAKEKTKEENVNPIGKNVPKDSIAIKKGSGETGKPKRANDERQLVPAQTIKHASEMDAVSEVQRFLNANPNYAKDIEKFAKALQQTQQKSQSENEESEEENDRKKMEKRDHRHGHHHPHKNNNNGYYEKITVKREICEQNNIHDYLSTIDDSLRKFGSVLHDNKHNNHHQHNCRRSPTTPTIREVSSSAASSSSSFESDEFVEEPRQQRSPDKRRNGRKNNSDNQQSSSIEATNMPDHFDDDDDMTDPETPPTPPRREHHRQRVADRFGNRRR
uniref:Uncharacterized protein n=1 Tax=Panagrolaimus davidi TaxID=227884 RepID=A0A914R3Y2_9BILA